MQLGCALLFCFFSSQEKLRSIAMHGKENNVTQQRAYWAWLPHTTLESSYRSLGHQVVQVNRTGARNTANTLVKRIRSNALVSDTDHLVRVILMWCEWSVFILQDKKKSVCTMHLQPFCSSLVTAWSWFQLGF